MTSRKLKALGLHLHIICLGQELRTRTRDLPGFGGMCHHAWQHWFLRLGQRPWRGQRPWWPPSAHTSPATASKLGISGHESPTQLAALVNFQMTVRQTVKLQLGKHSGNLGILPLSAPLLSPYLTRNPTLENGISNPSAWLLQTLVVLALRERFASGQDKKVSVSSLPQAKETNTTIYLRTPLGTVLVC